MMSSIDSTGTVNSRMDSARRGDARCGTAPRKRGRDRTYHNQPHSHQREGNAC